MVIGYALIAILPVLVMGLAGLFLGSITVFLIGLALGFVAPVLLFLWLLIRPTRRWRHSSHAEADALRRGNVLKH